MVACNIKRKFDICEVEKFHQNLNYLKECRKKIEKKLQELNLFLNKKTNILKVRDVFPF